MYKYENSLIISGLILIIIGIISIIDFLYLLITLKPLSNGISIIGIVFLISGYEILINSLNQKRRNKWLIEN